MERAKEKHPEGCLVLSHVWVSCTTLCAVCGSTDVLYTVEKRPIPWGSPSATWDALGSSKRLVYQHLWNRILHRAWYRIPKREKEPDAYTCLIFGSTASERTLCVWFWFSGFTFCVMLLNFSLLFFWLYFSCFSLSILSPRE